MDDTLTLLRKYKTLLEEQGHSGLSLAEVIKELTLKEIPYTPEGLTQAISQLEATNASLVEVKTNKSAVETIFVASGEPVSPTASTVDGVRMSVPGRAARGGNRQQRPTENQALAEASERRG